MQGRLNTQEALFSSRNSSREQCEIAVHIWTGGRPAAVLLVVIAVVAVVAVVVVVSECEGRATVAVSADVVVHIAQAMTTIAVRKCPAVSGPWLLSDVSGSRSRDILGEAQQNLFKFYNAKRYRVEPERGPSTLHP